jgi:tRNA(fMet)-specific endonuclease VapC
MTLLDTDILSLFMDGHALVMERIHQAGAVSITVITRIEILQGRFASLLKAASGKELLAAQLHLERSEQFLQSLPIISFDSAARATFDRLRETKKLKKIGRADLLIASIALTHRATLVTRNIRHFQQVVGLKIENWAK